MKKLLFLLSFATCFMFTSCDKSSLKDEGIKSSAKKFITYEFTVAEQENVNHYEIQVSTDAITYTTIGIIMASTKMEDNYKIKVNASKYFEKSNTVYSRIKSIDIDQRFLYSTISANKNIPN